MRHRARWITCLSAGVIMLGAVPAHAADYRYWMYWTSSDDTWTYSQVGPASVAVNDGDVQGWRFGTSSDDGATAAAPRFDLATAFDTICGGTTATDDQARVAMVIDPGDLNIAPTGEQPGEVTGRCALVPPGSTGASALSAVASLRVEDGFICAIDGYPGAECAAAVESVRNEQGTPDPPAPVETTAESDPIAFIIGGGVVLAGLATAVAMRRRRV